MHRLTALAALTLCGVAAHATPVVLSGTGRLSSGYGAFAAGDAFSLSGDYDDARAPVSVGSGFAFYPSVGDFTFIVDGVLFRPAVLFYTVFDGTTLSIFTPGDYYAPHVSVALAVDRPDGSYVTLPTAAEIAGRSGTLDFDQPGRIASGGVGRFATPATAATPEPSSVALFVAGLALLVGRVRGPMRRLRFTSRRRASRSHDAPVVSCHGKGASGVDGSGREDEPSRRGFPVG